MEENRYPCNSCGKPTLEHILKSRGGICIVCSRTVRETQAEAELALPALRPASHVRGERFEERAFRLISDQLSSGQLGLSPDHVSISRKSKHFSRDRNDHIVFDIGIEVRLPKADKPILLWLWECKDYSHSVPVDDVEEFHAKLQQVGGVNIKGGLITPSSLQAGALQYAKSRGIAVVRVLPEEQVDWISFCVDPDLPRPTAEEERMIWESRIESALNFQDFRATNYSGAFVCCNDRYPYSLGELALEFIHSFDD
jgi:hypothetical protein